MPRSGGAPGRLRGVHPIRTGPYARAFLPARTPGRCVPAVAADAEDELTDHRRARLLLPEELIPPRRSIGTEPLRQPLQRAVRRRARASLRLLAPDEAGPDRRLAGDLPRGVRTVAHVVAAVRDRRGDLDRRRERRARARWRRPTCSASRGSRPRRSGVDGEHADVELLLKALQRLVATYVKCLDAREILLIT